MSNYPDGYREPPSFDDIIHSYEQQLSEAKAEIERLKHDNHNLNWALGSDGYAAMYTEAEQAEADKAVEASMKVLESLKKSKSRFDAMAEEIERLQAHNAMLVDVVISTQSDLVPRHTRAETYRAVHNALSATQESTQQWLSEKLAQARKDALSFVAANTYGSTCDRERFIDGWLRRIDNEAQ